MLDAQEQRSLSILRLLLALRYSQFTMVILVTNTKGGVGKSTLAVHLLAWLHDHGQSAVLLDTDDQQTSFDWSSKALPDLPVQQETNPKKIVPLLKQLNAQYDFVICDTPGSYSLTTTMLPSLCDLALVPLQPSDADIDELSKALFHIQVAKQRRSKVPLQATLVLSLTAPNDARSTRLKNKLRQLGIPVAKQTVRRLNVVRDSAKKTVVFHGTTKMHRNAAQDFDKLFREVLKGCLKKQRRAVANG